MRKILIFAGPSAVGKTTLAKLIADRTGEFSLARSATTRAPRRDGNDGEYVYYSKEEFEAIVKNGGMLEYTEYAGELYGTSSEEIDAIIASGKTPLLILDLAGVKSVKASDYPSFSVYLYEDPNVLEERLYERYIGKAPSVEGLERFVLRKERNFDELSNIDGVKDRFDLFVRNLELDAAASGVLSAFNSGASIDNTAALSEIAELVAKKLEKLNNNQR